MLGQPLLVVATLQSIQHQALEWIATNTDSSVLPLYDESSSEREFNYLSQLYALCLLRLAMTNVGQYMNWMDDGATESPIVDFCAWNGVECIDGTNSVQKLILCKYTEVLAYVYLVSSLEIYCTHQYVHQHLTILLLFLPQKRIARGGNAMDQFPSEIGLLTNLAVLGLGMS